MEWPTTPESEAFQIEGFIESYTHFPERVRFEVVSRSESPDYLVKDENGLQFGVELTAVYLDDRSVPDHHMQETTGSTDIPYDPEVIEKYKRRIIGAIIAKICKARKGYDLRKPLILAIYVNEYISIYFNEEELKEFVDQYEGVFDAMQPFSEVVFWNLGNSRVFRFRRE